MFVPFTLFHVDRHLKKLDNHSQYSVEQIGSDCTRIDLRASVFQLSTVLGTGITATSTRKFARARLQSSSCEEFAAIVPTDVGSPSSHVIVADIKPGLGGLTWLRLVIMLIPGGVSSRGTSHCLPCFLALM